MPSLNVKDTHLEYWEKGEGEPLVLVHGSASDHRTWRFQRDAILGPGGFDRMTESRKAQVEDNLSTVRAEHLGPGFLPLDATQVRDVQAPTLLVTGEESIGLFHRLTDGLEELLPRARRVEIPQGAHIGCTRRTPPPSTRPSSGSSRPESPSRIPAC